MSAAPVVNLSDRAASLPVAVAAPVVAASHSREQIIEHLPALRAFALGVCRNDSLADDLVQETLLKAWSKFHLFDPTSNLRAWLFTILRNNYLTHLRKRSREVADVDGAGAARLVAKPEQDGKLALNEVAAAFEKLPPEQREVLWLVGAMGFTMAEAAETCGCAEGTIKSRANRARRALAAMLGLTGDEDMDLTDSTTMAVLNAQQAGSG